MGVGSGARPATSGRQAPSARLRLMDVRTVSPTEWRALREIRLRALADAPDAFGDTLARASSDPDEAWRDRARRPDGIAVVAADETGRFMGMASGGPAPDASDMAAIYGMWVDPVARGQHIGEALIGALADWAHDAGYETIGLGVTIGNQAASALYERLGFVDTGERFPLRDGSDLIIRILVTSVVSLRAYLAA